MSKIKLFILSFLVSMHFPCAYSQTKTLHFISDAHLDTQWNWDVKTTIDEYIPNTLNQNFLLFAKYPDFRFNFEGAIKYMWMKEYYPTQFETLKQHVQSGKWNISGGSIDANDVMVPSAESIIRNFLYGQSFYKKEFGRKGGTDMMLPDCFGFPYSLPTLAKHCGVTGFHTAKLAWGSAYDYNSLAPFGIWKGVDGSEIYAIFKGEAYDNHEIYNKDMSADAGTLATINTNTTTYGFPGAVRYVGPRGDRGGGLKDSQTETGENTPYWLQYSVNGTGQTKVKMSTPDEVFADLAQNPNEKYFIWNNELPMSTHGVGCYTSQAIMKYWNRKNELLADATEKTSVFAQWLGAQNYPVDLLHDSWVRILWHQFHDDLTGTSLPNAYSFSYNDEVLVNKDLSKTLLSSVGAVARQLDTQVDGIPLVIYNPLSILRNDIVEASVSVDSEPTGIRIMDNNGNEVLCQITKYDAETKLLSFIFEATVPSLGYATYDLRLNEKSSFTSGLSITNSKIENDLYSVTINTKGDVSSIFDKELGIELLSNPIRLAMLNDRSEAFPSWEIRWTDVNSAPVAYVDENVVVSVAENGPLRVSLKILRSKKGSDFVQYVRLSPSRISKRLDFVNEVNWQTRGTMLKAVFPLKAANSKATYDMSIGAIERGINTSNLYEVAGHQWADQTHTSGLYGVSILNDCKYGWDKPDYATLRQTLIHTPAVGTNYVYQRDQDLGLNKFTYSFCRHLGKWDENTQWEASKLNQPMLAFQAPKHEGNLGKSTGVISVSTNKVAVKALKKAEDSDEIIVRVYELTGNGQTDVKMTFPANITSAREVNGIEESVGSTTFSGNELSFNIGKFQPKTFALKLASPETTKAAVTPVSVKADLTYNVDIMSFDTQKANATSGVKFAYPAEQLSNVLLADGIEFKIGSRTDGAKNAILCAGQNITLPVATGAKKLYILAASKNPVGTTGDFLLDGVKYSFRVPYYAGKTGMWETPYNLGLEYVKENVAFTATHRHSVSDSKNDSYNQMYMYKYCIPLTGTPLTLTLPVNSDVYVLAVSLSDNQNDDLIQASEITSLPEYTDLKGDAGDCGKRLIPLSVRASNQNGANEGPEKAIDRDVTTKWCVTNNNTPWLEFTFDKAVEICRWFVLNAGSESSNYITKNFRLQRYENGVWIDVDVVTNNVENKVSRFVTPFTSQKVRLQVDQGEQNGTTTRVPEFAVYGKDDFPSSVEMPTVYGSGFRMNEIYPNPVENKAIIRCAISGNITDLKLRIYDIAGNLVDTRDYPAAITNGLCNIQWNCQSVKDGIYFYRVSAYHRDNLLSFGVGKMIVKK